MPRQQLPQATAQVNNIAPALFTYEDNRALAYALRIEPDGQQTVLSVRNTIVLDDRPVYLVLYATGIRNRSSVANVQCTIGGMSVPVEYAGPNGSGIPGLDQVNVRLTSDLKGLGLANLVLTVDGIPSNTVIRGDSLAGEPLRFGGERSDGTEGRESQQRSGFPLKWQAGDVA